MASGFHTTAAGRLGLVVTHSTRSFLTSDWKFALFCLPLSFIRSAQLQSSCLCMCPCCCDIPLYRTELVVSRLNSPARPLSITLCHGKWKRDSPSPPSQNYTPTPLDSIHTQVKSMNVWVRWLGKIVHIQSFPLPRHKNSCTPAPIFASPQHVHSYVVTPTHASVDRLKPRDGACLSVLSHNSSLNF